MPPIKGTASIASNSAQNKLLRSTKFPASFSQKVDVSKINASVVTLWVEKEIERILGFEDEIVASMAVNLFFPKIKTDDMNAPVTYGTVDPRTAQLDLAGFLGDDEAANFASQLWDMMLDGQTQPRGIPKILIEQKKAEIAAQKAAASKSGAHSGHDNSLVAEAARRAQAARQAIGRGHYDRPQNRGGNYRDRYNNDRYNDRRNQPRPVSPQYSVQQRQDPAERSRYDRDNRRRRSRSRSRDRHDSKRNEYSDDSSSNDSYGRRRHRKSKHRRSRDYDDDDDDRRSRKHSSRRRRSRSRSRSRSNDRSRTTRSYRDDRDRGKDRTSDRKSRGRSRREREYSRSRSRSNRKGRGQSESSSESSNSRNSSSSR